MFAGNFAPAGWMFCEGQLLPISENEVLFQLIGTTYGGDGQSNFGLPDLRGRLPMHQSNSVPLAQMSGAETVTLTQLQLPVHSHRFNGAAVTGDQTNAGNNLPANSLNVTTYVNANPDGNMNTAAVTPAGGNQPHDNMQPFLVLDFIISLFGIFPSPT